MKPWFSLTIVCWALLCLLLSLSQQAGLNHPLRVADSGPWLDRCGEAASGSPTAAVLRSAEFDPVRAGPLASIGPPGQETHGPPEPIGTWQVAKSKPAAQNNIQPTCLHEIYWLNRPNLKNQSFATAFS
jgi:hypothetical protein